MLLLTHTGAKAAPSRDHPGTGSGPPPHVRAVELKFAGDPDGLTTNVAVRARSVRLIIEEISTDYLPEASYRRSPQDPNCRVIRMPCFCGPIEIASKIFNF